MSTKPIVEGLRFGVCYPAAAQSQTIFAAFICEGDAIDYRDHLSVVECTAFEVVEL